MKFLSDAVQIALLPKNSVIGILRDNLRGDKPARDHKIVHASDLTKTDFCPRMLILLDKYNKVKKSEYISTALQTTFDVGNMTSELVREKWLGDSAIGNWECRKCGKIKTFSPKPSTVCASGVCDYKYKEVTFYHPESDTEGSIDVLVKLGSKKLFVVEIKIMNPTDFESIVAPLSEHRIRTNLYLRLIEGSTSAYKSSINTQAAKILYVSRTHGKKNDAHNGEILPFKEYTVVRQDKDLLPVMEKAFILKKSKEFGTLPEKICSTLNCATAKKCNVSTECFSTV